MPPTAHKTEEVQTHVQKFMLALQVLIRSIDSSKKLYLKVRVCVCVKSLRRVRLFETPWTVAHHAPLSMGFSRQEYLQVYTPSKEKE